MSYLQRASGVLMVWLLLAAMFIVRPVLAETVYVPAEDFSATAEAAGAAATGEARIAWTVRDHFPVSATYLL